jgi:hypothetical protein
MAGAQSLGADADRRHVIRTPTPLPQVEADEWVDRAGRLDAGGLQVSGIN